MALVTILSKKDTKKKRGRGAGLPLDASGSGSEDDEADDPLRRLSFAKGTLLLERLRASIETDPAAYVKAIETMACQVLGESSAGPSTEQLPWAARSLWVKGMGRDESLHVSIEQYKLDATWGTHGA